MQDETELSGEAFAPDDAAGVSDAELRALLAQAKATGDEPLRRMLASYLVLRKLSAEMIVLIEAREGAQTVTRSSLFSRLKHLTRRRAT
jgi:hypothetical protein